MLLELNPQSAITCNIAR